GWFRQSWGGHNRLPPSYTTILRTRFLGVLVLRRFIENCHISLCFHLRGGSTAMLPDMGGFLPVAVAPYSAVHCPHRADTEYPLIREKCHDQNACFAPAPLTLVRLE